MAEKEKWYKWSAFSKAMILIVALLVLVGGFYLANAAYKKGTGGTYGSDSLKTIKKSDGLKIEILKQGSGAASKKGDILSVHYVGRLENGDKFDSSIDRGVPLDFKLGAGNVIKGWDEGLDGMKVGEKRRLTVPPQLGYGSKVPENGPIPPNSILIFEVELVEIGK